jgi:hypothetical protein
MTQGLINNHLANPTQPLLLIIFGLGMFYVATTFRSVQKKNKDKIFELIQDYQRPLFFMERPQTEEEIYKRLPSFFWIIFPLVGFILQGFALLLIGFGLIVFTLAISKHFF